MSVALSLVPLAFAGKGRDPMVESQRQRRDGSLEVGEAAADAAVVRTDGTPARLLDAKRADRPLVVVFGSFT